MRKIICGCRRSGRDCSSKPFLKWWTRSTARSKRSSISRFIRLDFFPQYCFTAVDELFMETQHANLQKGSQQKLAAEGRDSLRAEIIRAKLKTFPQPDISKQSENGQEELKNDE